MERQKGMTLIEVGLALGIGSVILVALGSIFISSTRSVDYIVVDSASDQQVKKAIARIAGELQTSAPSRVNVQAGTPFDDLALQTPGPYSGTVTWGACDLGGTWQAGWTVRYTVEDGSLVRRCVDSLGRPVPPDETLARSIDGQPADRKGFGVTRSGSVATVLVRVRRDLGDGHQATKEYSSTVRIKNR